MEACTRGRRDLLGLAALGLASSLSAGSAQARVDSSSQEFITTPSGDNMLCYNSIMLNCVYTIKVGHILNHYRLNVWTIEAWQHLNREPTQIQSVLFFTSLKCMLTWLGTISVLKVLQPQQEDWIFCAMCKRARIDCPSKILGLSSWVWVPIAFHKNYAECF